MAIPGNDGHEHTDHSVPSPVTMLFHMGSLLRQATASQIFICTYYNVFTRAFHSGSGQNTR